MQNDSDKAWKYYGRKDPYFGVFVDERFTAENISENIEAFWETGESYISSRLKEIDALFGPLARRRALDFGSGVGRLSLPLARFYEAVVGLDISEAMLEEAAANARRQQISNATFALSDDTLSKAEGVFDFVHTYIVLQHIPMQRGLKIIDKLIAKVAPGGCLSLHVCTLRDEKLSQALLYQARLRLPLANGIANLLKGRPWQAALMQMNAYPVPRILEKLQAANFGPPVANFEMHGRFLTVNFAAVRKA